MGPWSISTPTITDRPGVLVAVCRLRRNAQPYHGKGTHQLKSCGDACWGTIVSENPMNHHCAVIVVGKGPVTASLRLEGGMTHREKGETDTKKEPL